MEQAVDAILQVARESASLDELSEVDVEEDRSSSLSDIDDKDGDQNEDAEGSDDLSNVSDEDNDSEAETERLEESPNKFRPQQDLVMSSRNNQTYQQNPSKLQQQIDQGDLEEEDDDDPLSDDELSVNETVESPKSSEQGDRELEPTTAPTSLGDASGDVKSLLSVADADSRKRKRSIMAGSGLDDELDEPSRKRTGSVLTPGDDYAIEDDIAEEEEDLSNPISGNGSGDEGGTAPEDEAIDEAEDTIMPEEEVPEIPGILLSPKRSRRRKKGEEDGPGADDVLNGDIAVNGTHEVRTGDDEQPGAEGDDEAEAAMKNEEELEKKRIALEQLSAIERQFSTFRDRLYDERLEQLNREEAMLRQDKPTHPEYLAMMQCIDARRNERIRVANQLREYQLQNLKIQSVAKRSQILVQYQQEVRDIREKKQEQLGKQWYEIQHDRRNHAGSVPDYALRYPTRRSQQVANQVAYNSEVSILSGVAKYVGFPAAPRMSSTTAAELEEDLEKMGRTRQMQQMQPAALPLQELAALRNVSSSSRFKPAEEQFIEQTPWANPQHPSHAHLIRQTSAQQTPRTASPFSQVQVVPRRHSHQQASLPISGTFSNSSSAMKQHPNGISMAGRISPHNPFGNSNHSHTIAPSPLGSRQPSLSPQQNRHPPSILEEQHSLAQVQDVPESNGNQHPPIPEVPRDFPPELRREQAAAMMTRF